MPTFVVAPGTGRTTVETADLMRRVAGPTLLTEDAGYQTECAIFNVMNPVRPSIAVGATSVFDVQPPCGSPRSGTCRWQPLRPGIR